MGVWGRGGGQVESESDVRVWGLHLGGGGRVRGWGVGVGWRLLDL